jgi:hypothetical protein
MTCHRTSGIPDGWQAVVTGCLTTAESTRPHGYIQRIARSGRKNGWVGARHSIKRNDTQRRSLSDPARYRCASCNLCAIFAAVLFTLVAGRPANVWPNRPARRCRAPCGWGRGCPVGPVDCFRCRTKSLRFCRYVTGAGMGGGRPKGRTSFRDSDRSPQSAEDFRGMRPASKAGRQDRAAH